MIHKARVVLLSVSMLFMGGQIGMPAMAGDQHEHEREHDRGGRSETRESRPASVPSRPGISSGARPAFDGRGQVLDQRYNHGHYYPPAGSGLTSLPSGYRPYFRGRDRYYFNGGVWYAPRGPGFVVIQPPVGLVISVLPSYCSTLWFGAVPYYYADNVYYTWQPDQNGYAVVDPPEGADQPSLPPENSAIAQDDVIVYPKNGQSKEQQAADQFECHDWAKNQTGFDPTQSGGGVQSGDADRMRNNYNRARSACLQGRGYQVN